MTSLALTEFESFYASHYKLVHGIASLMLQDPEDVADAIQLVFLKVFRRLQQGPIRVLPSYLREATKNTCLNIIRARKKREKKLAQARKEAEGLAIVPGKVEQAMAFREAFDKAIKRLSKRQRETFLLYVQGFTCADIAKMQGVDKNRVTCALSEARKSLRSRLAAVGISGVGLNPARAAAIEPLVFQQFILMHL